MGTHTTALRAPSPAARSPVDAPEPPRAARSRRRLVQTAPGPQAAPRSARHADDANDAEQLDDAQLEEEVHALRRWLRGHPVGAEAAQAAARLQSLEARVLARQPHAFRYGDTMVRWGVARVEGRATPYAAVPPGGRALAHVAAYLYAGEGATRSLLEDNPGLPDSLPPGTGLRLRVDALAPEARRNWERARRQDLLLLTAEVPGVGRGEEPTVTLTWRRRHVTLTRSQYSALLDHEAERVRQSVRALRGDLQTRIETHFRLAPQNVIELMVQEAVDGDRPRPGVDLWLAPLGRLTGAVLPAHGARSMEQLARAWLVVADVSEQLRRNVAEFDAYLRDTVARGEAIVARLETTRDVAFATAAALAGGAVVAGIVGQGGLTALTGAVAAEALAGGAVTGAAAYGGLEAGTATLGEAASTRAGEHIDWGHVRARTRRGLWHGGAIGAASAFEAVLLARFGFAFANETGGWLLTRIQALPEARRRLLLEALAQVPGATARSLLENLPAVLNGEMPLEQWLDLAGHDARVAGVAVGLRHVVGARLRTGPHASAAESVPANGATSPAGAAAHAPGAASTPGPTRASTGQGARDALRETVASGGSTALVDLPALLAGDVTAAQYGEGVLTGAAMSLGMTAARQTNGASRRALRERRQRLVRDHSPEARADAEASLTQRMRRQVGDRAEVVIDPEGGTSVHVTEGADGRVVLRVGADATEWHLRNHVESGRVAQRALGWPAIESSNRAVAAARRWLDRVGHRSLRQRGGQARQDIRKLGNMVAEADGMIGELEARQTAGRAAPEEAALLHELRAERESYARQIAEHRRHAGAVEARPIDIAANGSGPHNNTSLHDPLPIDDPRAPARGQQPLNSRYNLTRAQDTYFRQRIDSAESAGNAQGALQARYERYRCECANEVPPRTPASPSAWRARHDNMRASSTAGNEAEPRGREALGALLGVPVEQRGLAYGAQRQDGVLYNNNRGQVIEHRAHRPDSHMQEAGRVTTHDHKDFRATTQDTTVYNTEQIRAERSAGGRQRNISRHHVTISDEAPDLQGTPPRPRPSAPLSSRSVIWFVEDAPRPPQPGQQQSVGPTATHRWVPHRQGWEPTEFPVDNPTHRWNPGTRQWDPI
jgi:hypothetical protein